MKKLLIVVLLLIIVLIAGAFIYYKLHFPDMVADAVIAEKLPPYIPKHIQVKIDEFRKPVNEGAENMIVEMHRENIPMEKLIETIDNASDAEMNAFIEELANTKITSTNQVFDIGKKHFPVDYDVEVFRKPFNENVDLRIIRKGINYANVNRKTNDVSMETLKAITKKILLQKEKEFQNNRISE